MNRREQNDLKKIVQMYLNSPTKRGERVELNGEDPISSLNGKTTDVQTRIVLQLGEMWEKSRDFKALEVLIKIGGLEAPKESNISVEMPTIIDDVPGGAPVKAVVGMKVIDDSKESEDK